MSGPLIRPPEYRMQDRALIRQLDRPRSPLLAMFAPAVAIGVALMLAIAAKLIFTGSF